MHRIVASAKPAFLRRTSKVSTAFDTAQVLRRRSASNCSGARTLFNVRLLFPYHLRRSGTPYDLSRTGLVSQQSCSRRRQTREEFKKEPKCQCVTANKRP